MKPLGMAVMVAGMGNVGRRVVDQAARYQRFIIDAQAVGLSVEQAKAMFEHGLARGDLFDQNLDRCYRQVKRFVDNGYLTAIEDEA